MPTRKSTRYRTAADGSASSRLSRIGWPSGDRGRARPEFTEVPGFAATCDLVVAAGAAIMFSRTRDGGAIVVSVFDGDDRAKEYAAQLDELVEIFRQLAAAYAAE